MISAKPPCEILIDAEPTGLTTPQRAIPLRAGRHRITLVNREQDLEKTLAIQVAAGETAKVIEDLIQAPAGSRWSADYLSRGRCSARGQRSPGTSPPPRASGRPVGNGRYCRCSSSTACPDVSDPRLIALQPQ
jgi:hypothetical protein